MASTQNPMASTTEQSWGSNGVKGEEEDELALPTDTLALLSSFYDERDQHAKAFEDLRLRAEHAHASRTDGQDGHDAGTEGKQEPNQLKELSIEDFTEDWQLSQFWYDDATSLYLAQALLSAVTPPIETSYDTTSSVQTTAPPTRPKIAIISAPTAYIALHSLICSTTSTLPPHQHPTIHLLEHDPRFSLLPSFIPYDYTKPLILPASLTHAFDAILVDPPFLSEECQTKTALTVRKLLKAGGKLVVCTGVSVEGTVERVYRVNGVRRQGFEPRHRRGLANEFGCWANFGV